ncbi:MAG TPA: SLC13 family permease [Methanomassiliicoccales archaeon]|nr:SLC13 family permease [Methanomassiliicoccales archaeon]
MQTVTILALTIFVATYVLISIRNFRFFVMDRYAVALFGGGLMVVFGVVSASEAVQAVDLNTLALLLGMMLMVVGLEICGFFSWVAIQMITRSRNRTVFLAMVMAVTALLSALILNDTVVLILTPVVIKACRLIKANPVPYLIAEAISANIGSVATPVGNPQNAYIAMQSGISFNEFFVKLAPVAALSMLIAFILIWLVFRKTFVDGSQGNRWRNCSVKIDIGTALADYQREELHPATYFVLGTLAMVLVGFVLSSQIGLPLSMVAIFGGSVVLLFLPIMNRKATSLDMMRKVDWTLLLFFIGLFVLLKGVETSGLLDVMIIEFKAATAGGLDTIPGLTLFSSILSNLISNVPAVMLLSPFVSGLGDVNMWLALAASSTLAGNATILGAAANVIVVEGANKENIEISLKDFMKAGVPITIVTLLLSVLILGLL